MKSPRILVIESDEVAAGRVISFLEEKGYNVVRAVDTAGGLAMLCKVRPDLVIMAGSLPVFHGEDSFLRIRQASYLPIIVLGGIYDATEALELGADAYMNKPPSQRELLARVHALLRRHTNINASISGSDYNYFPGRASLNN